MTNAKLFKMTFGIYAGEFWCYTAERMQEWINTDVPDTNVGDTISRQAALSLAKDICVPTKDGTVYRHRCIDPQQIIELPSAQPEQRWIPVTERLPKPNEREEDGVLRYYLIQNEFGDMMVAAYRGNNSGDTWWEQIYVHKPMEDRVIAYMSLPEPWEGGDAE